MSRDMSVVIAEVPRRMPSGLNLKIKTKGKLFNFCLQLVMGEG